MRSWRSRLEARGGVSTVAGAVFFVIIMITLMIGITFWSMSVQREMNELDVARASEELSINEVQFLDVPEKRIAVNVTNKGPVALLIIAAWVIDATPGQPEVHYRVDLTELPDYKPYGGVPLAPGKTTVIYVPFDWVSGHVYDVKLITQRGRSFIYTGTRAP